MAYNSWSFRFAIVPSSFTGPPTSMSRLTTILILLLTCCAQFALRNNIAAASDEETLALEEEFRQTIVPFLKKQCLICHGVDRKEGELDLSVFNSIHRVTTAHMTWQIVLDRLEAGEMPPDESDTQPSMEVRSQVTQWIRRFRRSEAIRTAGDPGVVQARRLSNTEYNYSIRDLTGVDMQPTKEFPVDPANESGFDNSGESLGMSPALLKKYIGAARSVVDHLVLKPDGFSFAPFPVVTDTDRDKYCVRRIIDFYQSQVTDYDQYFYAAWIFRCRAICGNATTQLSEVAATQRISPKYLEMIWSTLETREEIGPISQLQKMWNQLPSTERESEAARRGCHEMGQYVVQLRGQLQRKFENLNDAGVHRGSQTFVLWKNRQYAMHRMKCNHEALTRRTTQSPADAIPGELRIPDDGEERERHIAAYDRFCAVFPDAFYISERGRDYLETPREEQERGRFLSAGFHSMMGYFRDDTPLCKLMLDEKQNLELDRLWHELDYVTSAPMRQYSGFVWFERTDSSFMRDPEFDFARAEDKDVTLEPMIKRLSQVYLSKVKRDGGRGKSLRAIEDFFNNINKQIRHVEKSRLASQPSHLTSLLKFAETAFRHPLTQSEKDELLDFYHSLKNQAELTHEEAVQDTIVYILMSPRFCYRLNRDGLDEARTAAETQQLTSSELASRLSYFLWASLPDGELLSHIASDDLQRPEVLIAQARRMVADGRVRGLATEFAGHWLDFRRFQEHNSVDRQRFPSFTNTLRQAMFEEPIVFFVDLVQHNGSALEFLYADHTFVNATLAKHYGMHGLTFRSGEWKRVDAAGKFGRGGLLPMAVFLTKNAPGRRTSPVKRGYWVVRRLLGERIPPPPPNVPDLPDDESKLGDLTLAETLARHRAHKSCSACHDRFDAIGLVFEGYGPVGELRELDLGGRPITDVAILPGGYESVGLDGLQEYLKEERQDEFLDNLCRKLLSYALGRTLLLSDDILVGEMKVDLAANQYRFGSLIETIITSPQFLTKRGHVMLSKE